MDPVLVTQKVVQGVFNGVRTEQLDHLAAETAAYLSSMNPEYETLAARIAVSNLQKQTLSSFYETAKLLYNYVNAKNGLPSPLIADDVFQIIEKNAELFESKIKYERDFNYNYFGFKTLERSYLFRVSFSVPCIFLLLTNYTTSWTAK